MWVFVLRNESTKFWLYVQAMEFLTLKVGKPRPASVVRGGITYEKDIYPPLLELIKESNGEMLFVDSDDERFSTTNFFL